MRFHPKMVAEAKRRARARRRRKKKKKKTLSTKLKNLTTKVYNNLQPCWIDTLQAPLGIGAGGYINGDFCSLQQIAQGDDVNQRQGNKITVKSLDIKAQVRCANGDVFNELRLIIFSLVEDPQGNPAASDILQNVSNAGVYSFYRKGSPVKYRIHWDKTYQMSNPLASVATQPSSTDLNGCPYKDFIHIKKKIKFKNHQVWYRGAGGSQPIKGGIYLLAISDSLNQLPTGHPTMSWNIRMHYDP